MQRFVAKSILASLLFIVAAASNLHAAGITLVTHGNQPSEEYPEWVAFMANAIGEENIPGSWSRYKIIIDDPGWDELRATVVQSGTAPTVTDSGEIVIELDWSRVAGGFLVPDYSTADIAEKVVDCLTNPDFFPGLGRPAVELPMHFAGHSRGGVLVAQIAELLGRQGIWVGQVTTLDPVPLPQDTLAGAFPMRLRENVLFADNYIQTLALVRGSRLEGSYPRPAWDDPADLADGYASAHSDVHLWYHGTVDLNTPTADGAGPGAQTITPSMRSSTGWWSSSEMEGEQAGFYYSRILGGTYDGGTRSAIGYTPPTSPFREPWAITASGRDVWDNVEIADVDLTEPVYPGDTFQVATWFYDLNNDAAITWGVDPGNQNPYRSTARTDLASIATASIPFGAGESLTTARYRSQALGTATLPPGSYCVYARISNGTRTRYYYYTCDEEHALYVACLDNAQCDDGVFCNGPETCVAGACAPSGDPCEGNASFPVCDEVNDTCAECLEDSDCGDFYTCESNVCEAFPTFSSVTEVTLKGPGELDVIFDPNGMDIALIELTGTTKKSSLKIKSMLKNSFVFLDQLDVDGALKSIKGKNTFLTGELTAKEGIDKIEIGGTETGSSIEAPWIGSLKVAADFAGDMTLTGAGSPPKGLTLGKATIKGMLWMAQWLISGDVGSVSVTFWGPGSILAVGVDPGSDGAFFTGDDVATGGLLGRVKYKDYETYNAGDAFGIIADEFARLKLDLPFRDDDFHIQER